MTLIQLIEEKLHGNVKVKYSTHNVFKTFRTYYMLTNVHLTGDIMYNRAMITGIISKFGFYYLTYSNFFKKIRDATDTK